ncbi:MAG: Radical SAM domain protein [Candidatus Syntrophoarchaeum butanivorans]|uniref:Radical SAM domain protein n=1 Tax=Candidatus Syntropharchaeum butanivorans TaxID=1839936 RepID=A0A1F2P7C9_9EURY|nr:MAG: Radical SAM domain protein [Candidatus Syntrophoarchaeum butanivorans]
MRFTPKIKRLIFLLRNKGFRWTYNYIHFSTLYMTKNPLLIKLLQWLEPYPSYIEVEITTKCNLKCIMCEHTYWDEPSRDMSFEDFKKIVDQFPKLKWIGLTGIGESFLNKDFIKMLRYVKSKGIYVELYDTFYFIDENNAKELIKLGVDKLILSFDAATKETYEKIRVGSDFDRVVNNLKNFIRLKNEMNSHFPEMEFHYIISRANVHEVPDYIELIRSLVPDTPEIFFTRMLHEFEETKDLFVEIPQEIVEHAEAKARDLGVKISWNLDVPAVKPPINHCVAWYMPFIFVTGHVIPCCSGNEANQREFQKETSLGNVFEASFKEIWRGAKYKELRRKIRRGEVPEPCKNCCLYDVGR